MEQRKIQSNVVTYVGKTYFALTGPGQPHQRIVNSSIFPQEHLMKVCMMPLWNSHQERDSVDLWSQFYVQTKSQVTLMVGGVMTTERKKYQMTLFKMSTTVQLNFIEKISFIDNFFIFQARDPEFFVYPQNTIPQTFARTEF